MSSEAEERISIEPCPATTVHTLAGQQQEQQQQQQHGREPAQPRPWSRPWPRPRHHRRRKRKRRLRFMQRDGRFQVILQKGPWDWSPYLMDIYTTLVEIRWRVMLLLFSLSYILSWLLFALLYWLIAFVHGDLLQDLDLAADPPPPPCVENVRTFTAAFLFSMETQATIGYGFRGMTENCMAAIVVVTVQDLLSCLIDTVVIGVAVAKMASARKRAQTVGFSRCAVVNARDGALCLSWRLGDFRRNHLLEGVARAQLVRYGSAAGTGPGTAGPSGAVDVIYRDLELQDRDVVLVTPATVFHRLGPGSPLYHWYPGHNNNNNNNSNNSNNPWEESKEEMEEVEQEEEGVGVEVEEEVEEDDFELVVSFTYTDDSTGMLHQTRTSYAAEDIRWGQRFRDMVRLGDKCYKVDYALFNQTTWVPVPRLSARDLDLRGGGSGTSPGRAAEGRTEPEPPEVIQEARL
ncbi:hypothetical protein CRUP_023166 [Coryphaenoides rupestris]|nr:hypothetical protein CRUP_023166 [Coryphaenoides rupestris]